MKKRQMMFIPEVNPNSFVFFFEKGTTGGSWSIRDYSAPDGPKIYRPEDLPWNADDIHLKARHSFDAPAHRTEDVAFWRKRNEECNTQYLVHG